MAKTPLSSQDIQVMKGLGARKISWKGNLEFTPSLHPGDLDRYAVMADMGRRLPKVDARQAYLKWAPSLGSPTHLWAHHPLYQGVRLLETQVTRALVHFLDPDISGDTSGLRCRTFLEALYASAGMGSPFDGGSVTGLRMGAEEKIPNWGVQYSRRCDIIITWRDGVEIGPQGVVIEVKLGHILKKEQLDAYYRHLLEVIPGKKKAAFLLAPKNNNNIKCEMKRSEFGSEWVFVDWFSVLWTWERYLYQEKNNFCSVDFNRFRRSLFDLILLYPR